MTICEQYYCAVYLYTISSVAISLLKLSLFLYIMDQSDLVLRLHGAVQANETRTEDIQTAETEGAGTVLIHTGPLYKDIQTGAIISSQRVEEINAGVPPLNGVNGCHRRSETTVFFVFFCVCFFK